MTDERDPMAEKALDAVRSRYTGPQPETVEGEDFREGGAPADAQAAEATRLEVELARICDRHEPIGDAAKRHEALRNALKAFIRAIALIAPVSEERAVAVTRAREAHYWATAAVACNPDKLPKPPE